MDTITLRCLWSCGHQGSASFRYTDRQFWSCEGRFLSMVLKSFISFFLTSCLSPCSSKSHLLLAQKIPTPSSVIQSSPGITSVPQFRSWSSSTTPIITSDTHSMLTKFPSTTSLFLGSPVYPTYAPSTGPRAIDPFVGEQFPQR